MICLSDTKQRRSLKGKIWVQLSIFIWTAANHRIWGHTLGLGFFFIFATLYSCPSLCQDLVLFENWVKTGLEKSLSYLKFKKLPKKPQNAHTLKKLQTKAFTTKTPNHWFSPLGREDREVLHMVLRCLMWGIHSLGLSSTV